VQEILLPGDPERRALAARTAGGVPLDDGNWNELVKLAARLKVEVPKV
jgi:LDH2 family malate/lactate/ureidoglycolate dehydrogenase